MKSKTIEAFLESLEYNLRVLVEGLFVGLILIVFSIFLVLMINSIANGEYLKAAGCFLCAFVVCVIKEMVDC